MTPDEVLDHTKLTFGKYKDRKTPSEVAEIEPSYIVWMYENVNDKPTCSKALYEDCRLDAGADDDDYLEPPEW